MKPPKQIARKSIKLKRGEEYIYNGEHVWVELEKSKGEVLVCWSKERGLSDRYDTVKIADLKPVNGSRGTIKQVLKPVSAEERKRRGTLDEFFDRMALKMPYNCMECNRPLYAFTKKFKRAVTCHILPKAEFPSIATNEHNIFFLGWSIIGVCTHHDDWDRKGSENRTKMKVYDYAINQFNEFLKHELSDHDKIKALTYLNIKFQ